eukprot:m.84715 g.84715  ORF g.84715 m.84715 type:complete len:353 (-) comp14817_c0_seq1:1179-2237(-)
MSKTNKPPLAFKRVNTKRHPAITTMRLLGLQCGACLLAIAVFAAATTGPNPLPKQVGTVSVSEAVIALLGFLPGSTGDSSHTVAAKVPVASPLPPHPRLRVRDDAIVTIKALISNDAEAARYYQALVEYGNTLLSRPLINCSRAGVEHSLLTQARDVLDKAYTLGLLFRINGNQTFAQRAIAEMVHVTGPACVDWNPSHFLDTAEMTHAVAIGYDWLYQVLTPSQRQAIEQGTIVKGLDAGVTAYKHNLSFLHTVYNWDLVTNAGLLAGAIAFADVNASVSAVMPPSTRCLLSRRWLRQLDLTTGFRRAKASTRLGCLRSNPPGPRGSSLTGAMPSPGLMGWPTFLGWAAST